MEQKPGTPKSPDRKVYKAAVVDTSKLAEAQARDLADHRMTESEKDRSGNWVSRIGKRIWKHNLFQEFYRQREISRARKEIAATGNLYAGEQETDDIAQHEKAMAAVVDRFTSAYEEETLKQDERDSKRNIDGPANIRIKELIKAYASNKDMPKAAFIEERNRILSALDPDYARAGSMHADNLLTIATELRNAKEHGEKLADEDFDIELTLGKARGSLNTEAQMNMFDRTVERMQNSHVGRIFMNEGTVAIAAAAYSVIKSLGTSALRSNAAKIGTFGAAAVLGGGIAAAKESARLERERAQHMRESAKGMTFEGDDTKRRDQMDENRYETRNAREVTAKLDAARLKVESGRLEGAELAAALQDLVDVESRIRLGDMRKSDLISYSRFDEVEKERTALDVSRAKLKVALRKADAANTAVLPGTGDFNAKLSALVDTYTGASLEDDLKQKDRIFKSMKRKQVAKTFLKTVAIGGAAGFVFQEVAAALTSDNDGLIEGAYKSITGDHASQATHTTALEGLRRWLFDSNDATKVVPPPSVQTIETVVVHGAGANAVLPAGIDLPAGMNFHENPDGTYDLLQGKTVIGGNLKIALDSQGNPTPDSLALLAKQGIHTSTFETPGPPQHVSLSEADYMKAHMADTHAVHRELWYDNDTPHPFDKNELRGWWGGPNNTGVNPDGNYSFTMQHMTPDGSYHNGLSVDAKDAMKHHNLKMIFSLSRASQHQVFEVPIDEHGNAIIPKDSPLAKLMFENVNGHAVFKGKFAEVVQDMGPAKDGVDTVRVLATYVGLDRHDGMIEDIVPGPNITHLKIDPMTPSHGLPEHLIPPKYVLPSPEGPTTEGVAPQDWNWDAPPFVPVVARRPLEQGKHPDALPAAALPIPTGPGEFPVTAYPYMYGTLGENLAEAAKAMLSETLKENPDAELDPKKESETYFSHQDPKYMERVDALAEQAGPMSPDCKLSICIPVAGHQEENNIERTLSTFLNQSADPKTFEVVLFINHPDVDRTGTPIRPDGTAAKVEAFKKAHPELNVRVMSAVVPISDARIGIIRKLLNDAVLRRSSKRSVSEDLIMVSNDADTKGVAPTYVDNFIKKIDGKEADASLGQLDWDPDSYIRNPLVHIGTRWFQYLGVQSRQKGWFIDSSGANFAFKSSIYAAIGGYRGLTGGEDSDIGERIKRARDGAEKHKTPIVFGGARVSRVYTSSRRAEKAVRDGYAPVEQWNQGFSAFDDEVRRTKWEDTGEPIDYDNPEVVKKLVSEIEVMINRSIRANVWIKNLRQDETVPRVMRWLRIKYAVTDDNKQIRITDSTLLVKDLKKYQKDGLKMMARKIAKELPKSPAP